MNVKLEGIADRIAESAIKAGLAKTKTDAILLGLVELDHRYKLIETYENGVMYHVARNIDERIGAGKERVYSEKEFKKRTGARF